MRYSIDKFNRKIIQGFFSNYYNNYSDNIDPYYNRQWLYSASLYDLFYSPEVHGFMPRLFRRLNYCLSLFGFINMKWCQIILDRLLERVSKWAYLADFLEIEEDIELLIALALYNNLGHKKIKLPHYFNAEYWKLYKKIDKLFDKSQKFKINKPFDAYKINLESMGYPIKLYDLPPFTMSVFGLNQYSYKNSSGFKIAVKSGDCVIDAGTGWGNTALYFANQVGEEGRVYTFEALSKNLEIIHKNFSLNPVLEKCITLVPKALWDTKTELEIVEDILAVGNYINTDQNQVKSPFTVDAIPLDEFVFQEEIKKVDFIKMDIEGSELAALKGARNVLHHHKPNLAISLYHKPEDVYEIPMWLSEQNLGYRFYLGHYTIHREETVLFATVR